MRVLLRAKAEIPGLAEKGAVVCLRMDDLKHPISVTVEHGPEVLHTVYEHAEDLEVLTEPAPSLVMLQTLQRLLGREPYPEVKVVK